MAQKKMLQNDDANILNLIRFKYFPYWPLFILLLSISTGGAWFYLRHKVPIYESTATILIKDEKKGIEDAKMIESLNQLATNKIIENEIEIIKSRSLMKQVIKNLHLYAPVFEEGSVITKSAYTTSPVLVEAKEPDELGSSGKTYFTFDLKANVVDLKGSKFLVGQWVKMPFGEIRFINNPHYRSTKNIHPLYFNVSAPKYIVDGLAGALTAYSSNKSSTVINLKYQDESPERGQDILNELIKAYNKEALDDKNILAANTLEFVQGRLSVVAHDLDSIERKLQEYKSSRGAYDISSQSKLFLDNVSSNDNKLSDINIQLSVLNQVENYVTSKSSGAIVPSTLGISDPLLSQLLDKLYDLELQHEKLKKTTAENNPLLVSISDQITKIKPSILENIRSQRKSLEASRVNLSATNGSYSSILQTIPQKEKDLVNISREQGIISGIYNFLSQKREEAALSYSSTVADNRVIDKAESSESAVSPNKRNVYLVFLIAGMGLGIGFITLKEALNNKILYRDELEQFISYPVIGEINFQNRKIDLVMEDNRSVIVAEQFRKLRATLGFMKINSRIKNILVTSSISQEGKSFTAANLGLTLAMAGKKVILIELDLINPSLSKKFGINSTSGVTDFLTGECEPEEIIKRTVANENLFIIPSGSLPQNPSELILNGRVEDLLNYLNRVFDYVIIDSTPVCALSDAYIFSPMCDITLYVVRHGFTPKILIRRLERNDMTKNLKNVGIVFNGIKSRGFFKKDNNEYGYGYNYIYNRKLNTEQKSKSTG